jgi:repressor LexA
MVAKMEQGQRLPGVVSLRRIGEALGVPLSALLTMDALPVGTEASDARTPRSGRLPDGTRHVFVPLLGQVVAGRPSEALPDIESWVPVAGVKDSARLFALRVEGESMIGAGIFANDLLIVRSQSTAQPGQIVVARVGDDVTVKTFHTTGAMVVLQAENPRFSPVILPHDRVQIQGIVIELRRNVE